MNKFHPPNQKPRVLQSKYTYNANSPYCPHPISTLQIIYLFLIEFLELSVSHLGLGEVGNDCTAWAIYWWPFGLVLSSQTNLHLRYLALGLRETLHYSHFHMATSANKNWLYTYLGKPLLKHFSCELRPVVRTYKVWLPMCGKKADTLPLGCQQRSFYVPHEQRSAWRVYSSTTVSIL